MTNLRTKTITGSIKKSTGLSSPRSDTKIHFAAPATSDANLVTRLGEKMYSYSTKQITISPTSTSTVSVNSLPGSSTVR